MASCVPALLAALAVPANAMHIMEGFLPQTHAIVWGVVCLPFLVWSFIAIRKIVSQHRKTILLLAMMGAYAFVLSALKMPSVTGSSSHPTGTGLGAVLFGPAPMAVLPPWAPTPSPWQLPVPLSATVSISSARS